MNMHTDLNMQIDEPMHTDEPTRQIAVCHALRELEQDAMNAKRLADWKRRYWCNGVEAPAPVTPGWPCMRSAMADCDQMAGNAVIGNAIATAAQSLDANHGDGLGAGGFVVNVQIVVVPSVRGIMLEFRHPAVTAT